MCSVWQSWSLCLSCFVMHTLICVTFSLPPGVGGWLRLLLVALPGLYCLPCHCLTWKRFGSFATRTVHNKVSDQTGWMSMLIWVFSVSTVILLVFVMLWLICQWFLVKHKNLHFILAHLSQRLTRWAYSIPMVCRPSVIVSILKLECLRSQLANLDQILCVASLGWGKGCIRFWGRLDQSSGFHDHRKLPLTYNGENDVSTFSRLFLIQSF